MNYKGQKNNFYNQYKNNNYSNNYNYNNFNIDNDINNKVDIVVDKLIKNENQNKLPYDEFDQALSLNDKFIFKDIDLEISNNNNLFCYVPEENIQGLYSINFQPSSKKVKFNYLKHYSFLGNKRTNLDNIIQNFDNNNNNINNEPNNNIENFNNIDIIFKTIFKNRKTFYGNNEIKKI